MSAPTGLPRVAQVYLWAVVSAAAGLLAYWSWAWQGPLPTASHELGVLALLLALAVLAVHFRVAVAPRLKVTVSRAVYFAGLLLVGAPAAMGLVGAAQLVGGATLALRRRPQPGQRLVTLCEVAFNTGQLMLATGLGSLVYFAFLPHTAPAPLERPENLWALPAAAAAVYGANSGAVALMVGLQLGRSPREVWLAGRRVDALQSAALFGVGVVTALAAVHYPWAPVVVALPAAGIYLSLRRAVQLVEQATAAQEAQRQLARQMDEAARREAEAAALRDLDRLKNELLSTISHELRAPLTIVHGYAQRLRARAHALSAETVETTAQRILTSSTHLTRLVEDLLDFARMERGEVAVRPEAFDLAPALHEILGGLRRQPGGERLVADVAAPLPVYADRARLAQVVANLVENACKYAPTGPIVVHARECAAAPADPLSPAPAVEVEVEDQGPGISLAEQPRVWDKFVRGAAVAELNVARGTGIGLAVVKTLVEAQGGQVGLESTPGGGARFWFTLPAAPVPPTAADSPLPSPAAAWPAAAADQAPAAAAVPAYARDEAEARVAPSGR